MTHTYQPREGLTKQPMKQRKKLAYADEKGNIRTKTANHPIPALTRLYLVAPEDQAAVDRSTS